MSSVIDCVCFSILFIVAGYLFFVADTVTSGPQEYFHNEDVAGWIKLHKSAANFKEAYLTCFYEGAILASPINRALANILEERRKLTKGLIWMGTHALFSEGDYLSVEGVSLNDMPISVSYGFEDNENCVMLTSKRRAQTTNCTRPLPYMCYRPHKEQAINFKCGTFDNKYILEPRTGSCYKLHKESHEWIHAHSICAAEGGYLAVINNEEEAHILKNMSLKRTLRISKYDDWEPLFIGLRDWDQKGLWSTVQGDSLQNVYHVWAWGQPDNLNRQQYCGSLLRTGKLDDTWCNVKAMFVCEKDPLKGRFQYPKVAGNLTAPDPLLEVK